MTAEAAALLACLRAQREHVLGILEGLPEHDLRRPVLPSGWTCLGLVRHLALDVERFCRAVVAGEDVELEHGDAAWTAAPDVPARAVLDLYRREAELADAVITATPLDATAAWWPGELFEDLPPRDPAARHHRDRVPRRPPRRRAGTGRRPHLAGADRVSPSPRSVCAEAGSGR